MFIRRQLWNIYKVALNYNFLLDRFYWNLVSCITLDNTDQFSQTCRDCQTRQVLYGTVRDSNLRHASQVMSASPDITYFLRGYIYPRSTHEMLPYCTIPKVRIWFPISKTIWARSTTKPTKWRAPSEDSDQPGHPPSLIRVFAVRMKKPWVFSFSFSVQRRLWSDRADVQADLSLRWAHRLFCFDGSFGFQ